MIGYTNWAKVLNKAKADASFKSKVKSNVPGVAESAILLEVGLTGSHFDQDDKDLLNSRYKTAVDSATKPFEQLFEGLVGLLGCPTDCVSKQDLDAIAKIIFDKIDDPTVDVAAALVESLLKKYNFVHGTYSYTQFCDILLHLAPSSLPLWKG